MSRSLKWAEAQTSEDMISAASYPTHFPRELEFSHVDSYLWYLLTQKMQDNKDVTKFLHQAAEGHGLQAWHLLHKEFSPVSFNELSAEHNRLSKMAPVANLASFPAALRAWETDMDDLQ